MPRPAPRLSPVRTTAGPRRSCSSVPTLDRVPPVRRHGPTPRTATVFSGPRADRLVYLRRRLVLATVATLAVLGAIRLSPGFSGGGPLAASGEPGSARPAADRIYVVQSGDTVWSIAHRFVPKGDERPLVDAITSELNGASVVPGQAIVIP